MFVYVRWSLGGVSVSRPRPTCTCSKQHKQKQLLEIKVSSVKSWGKKNMVTCGYILQLKTRQAWLDIDSILTQNLQRVFWRTPVTRDLASESWCWQNRCIIAGSKTSHLFFLPCGWRMPRAGHLGRQRTARFMIKDVLPFKKDTITPKKGRFCFGGILWQLSQLLGRVDVDVLRWQHLYIV